MAAKKDSGTAPAVPAISAVLRAPVEQAARNSRVIMARRVDLGKQLTAKEIGKLADSDADLTTQLAQAAQALADADQATTAWQQGLAEASAWWDACLADLARFHPDVAAGGEDGTAGDA